MDDGILERIDLPRESIIVALALYSIINIESYTLGYIELPRLKMEVTLLLLLSLLIL